MNDLRFDQATAEEFRDYWEGQGWTVDNVASLRLSAWRKTSCGLCVRLQAYLGGRGDISLGETPFRDDLEFEQPVTTFGEALEILNELAATRAFGGWAKEEGNAEGA